MTADTNSFFCRIIVLCIFLGSIRSNKTEVTAYNFEYILEMFRFFLWDKDICTLKQKHASVIYTGDLFYQESDRIQMNHCMSQVAYIVSGVIKSTSWDDAVFIQGNSQLVLINYPLTSRTL